MTTNPILTEIQNLSPAAQNALAMAGHAIAQPPPTVGPGMGAPTPTMTPPSAPSVTQAPTHDPGIAGLHAPVITPQMKADALPKDAAGPAPILSAAHMGDSQPMPQMSAPAPESVSPMMRGTVQGDDMERQRLLQTGSGVDQIAHRIEGTGFGQNHPILGKILGVGAQSLAKVGDIGLHAGLNMVAPGLDRMIPGTDAHHEQLLGNANDALKTDLENVEKTAQTQNLELQPELRQAQERLKEEQAGEKVTHDRATEDSALAQHGFARDETDPTGRTLRPLRYEEMSEPQQAQHDLKGAQSEMDDARKMYLEAQKNNIPAQMKLAQGRLDVAQKNAQTALQRLGLSTQEFGFNQDKFYNPQPTAHERQTGDLATSAHNQIQTMREIIKAHPDMVGPGGGAKQAFQRFLSSDAEDAGRFLAASNYLAEHSAATFGGRGAYIVQQLHGMTNPNYDPSALNGVLDQADETAQHFVKAGQTHAKGTQGEAAATGKPTAPKEGDAKENSAGDKVVFRGGKWQAQ